jgi:hypothetical protein
VALNNKQKKKKSVLKHSFPKVTPHECDSNPKKCSNRKCTALNQIVRVSAQRTNLPDQHTLLTKEPNSLLVYYDYPTTLAKLVMALSSTITCIDFGVNHIVVFPGIFFCLECYYYEESLKEKCLPYNHNLRPTSH